jgi:septal ring factor EnvC (AmiA/AmiB activator)
MGALELNSKAGRVEAFRALENITMDESTQQLLNALTENVRLQLKPIEERLHEVVTELKQQSEQSQDLEKHVALFDARVTRIEHDLTKGLKAVRIEIDEALGNRMKVLTPAFAAVAGVVSVITGLFVWWIKT